MDGGQWEINTILASTGYVVTMTDYLGLGDSDPRIPIPPYSHGYSESNAMINILRAARLIADTLEVALNEQIFILGYSQGGAATAATVKEIQQNYESEFTVTASAPMSGAYDFSDAQVDLIASTDPYPTPAYFPYIILSYQSVYNNLFTSPSEFLKSPYDTLLPPLYYAGNSGLNALNNLCDPVPRNMVIDSVMDDFLNNPNHPMRLNLLDNDLINGWFPTSPMKLFYCNGDDQVTSLNAEKAYTTWTNAGAPFLEKADFGNFNHNTCAPFTFINAKNYFDSFKDDCNTSIQDISTLLDISVFPNPTANEINLSLNTENNLGVTIVLLNNMGMELSIPFEGMVHGTQTIKFNTSDLSSGFYFIQISSSLGTLSVQKVMVQH
jgi:pimeloyl-ACP methyl ester carboxylesterase